VVELALALAEGGEGALALGELGSGAVVRELEAVAVDGELDAEDEFRVVALALEEVVAGAELQRGDDDILVAQVGEEDEGRLQAAAADLGDEVEAVHPREQVVAEQQVEDLAGLQEAQGVVGVGRRLDRDVRRVAREMRGEERGLGGVVVDQQNAARGDAAGRGADKLAAALDDGAEPGRQRG